MRSILPCSDSSAEALLLVRLEHVGETEALAAHVARVGLFTGVRAPVPLHVGPAGEALAADLADVRLLPCRVGGDGPRGVAGGPPRPPPPTCEPASLTRPWESGRPGLSLRKGQRRMPTTAQRPSPLDSSTCVGLHVLIKVLLHVEVFATPLAHELLVALQCSCLENPRGGGAWWAAVYGVAQSRTRLKRLSSSRHLSKESKE